METSGKKLVSEIVIPGIKFVSGSIATRLDCFMVVSRLEIDGVFAKVIALIFRIGCGCEGNI